MKKGNIIILAKQGTDTASIKLYGIIGNWSDVNGNSVAEQIVNLEGQYKNLKIYLNSDGGGVIEGIAIFNILKRSTMNISIYVDGVAASMASVLLQLPNAKRYMARFTRTMVHRVSGSAAGSVEDLRSAADMMEGFEADLITIIAERTKKTVDEVKSAWFDGKDHWFTPDKALAAGLIDEVIDGKISQDANNINAVPELVNFYSEQISNFNSNNEVMDLTNLINHLRLQAGADQAAIENAVKNIVTKADADAQKIKDLETKVEDYVKKEGEALVGKIKDMIDNAIKVKKITEKERPLYTNLAKADFDSTKSALDAIAAPQKIGTFIGNEGTDPIPEDRKNWSFQDWQKNDGKGLENLRKDHSESFQNLKGLPDSFKEK